MKQNPQEFSDRWMCLFVYFHAILCKKIIVSFGHLPHCQMSSSAFGRAPVANDTMSDYDTMQSVKCFRITLYCSICHGPTLQCPSSQCRQINHVHHEQCFESLSAMGGKCVLCEKRGEGVNISFMKNENSHESDAATNPPDIDYGAIESLMELRNSYEHHPSEPFQHDIGHSHNHNHHDSDRSNHNHHDSDRSNHHDIGHSHNQSTHSTSDDSGSNSESDPESDYSIDHGADHESDADYDPDEEQYQRRCFSRRNRPKTQSKRVFSEWSMSVSASDPKRCKPSPIPPSPPALKRYLSSNVSSVSSASSGSAQFQPPLTLLTLLSASNPPNQRPGNLTPIALGLSRFSLF